MDKMRVRKIGALLLGGLAVGALCQGVAAQQDYPNKPIRFISPYAPGGSTSFTARLIAQHLTEAWGQPVVVDNRPGANTVIGTLATVKSRPDGYTIMTLGGTLAGNYWLVKTPYDALKDIAPMATLLSYENVLVVAPQLQVNTVAELVAMAKAKPDQITYGTSSIGGPTHLLAELFNNVAAIKTRHIPYKGGAPAVVDLMGGHIHFFFSNPSNVATQIRTGRLKALAVTGQTRVGAFPDAPTFAEAGMPAMTLTNWQGLGGPAGIPKPIIDKMSAEIRKLAALPDTKDKLATQGFEPFYNNAERTAELIKLDIARYGKIIKEANIKME
jgi:tripartite-type tricarboxylate transporter receptor subunit TctC